MMNREIFVERVLIVLNSDGTLKGAHQESLERVSLNGVTIAEKQGAAMPLQADSLALVLPEQTTLLAQLDGLMQENEFLKQKIATLENGNI